MLATSSYSSFIFQVAVRGEEGATRNLKGRGTSICPRVFQPLIDEISCSVATKAKEPHQRNHSTIQQRLPSLREPRIHTIAGSTTETTMSAAQTTNTLKHDRFYPLPRKTTQNATWNLDPCDSSSSCSSSRLLHQQQPDRSAWPLQVTLKDRTREALFREFGLKGPSTSSSNAKPPSSSLLLSKLRRNSRNSALSNSNKDFLQNVEARMLTRRREASREEGLSKIKSYSSASGSGGLNTLKRSSDVLLSSLVRPATVLSLHRPHHNSSGMRRTSTFREAIKHQYQSLKKNGGPGKEKPCRSIL